ncbi:VOC family protein [Rhizorhapis suberifaciens]|uniref:Catechol 2,3-dioxygenase-like lactoylglutathione lyase family enzyme n=1 Tax=Rhizorhapis suberifaciens TaxID=13656 RepID=A0A840HSF0_9SPHN|nr:VOC family protein [Rhizorhapis suberifaciens]MBB4640641.1 catechol 2,3-dioxygenase-like lactoylglutathione lyase family enzyme [Rhizorhapis suberifaciens]
MFTHIMVGADDIEASKAFYDAIFQVLGIAAGERDPLGRIFYRTPTGSFGITKPIDGQRASAANGGTIGFAAVSREQVEAWHDAGVKAGGVTCEAPPGVREPFRAYAAYLRDPVGNKLCVSCMLGGD